MRSKVENRRQCFRFRTDPIFAKVACGLTLYPGFISNLGEYGLKLHVEKDLKDCCFSIIIPTNEGINNGFLVLQSEKKWIKKEEKYGLYLIGCEFTNLSPKKKQDIQQLIHQVKI